MYRLKSFFGLGFLLIGLAGCTYTSDKALVSADQAAFPFDPYAVITFTDDPAHDSLTIVRKGDDYLPADPSGPTGTAPEFRFMQMADGYYAVQFSSDGKSYSYVATKIDLVAKKIDVFEPPLPKGDLPKGLRPCGSTTIACIDDFRAFADLVHAAIASGYKPLLSYDILATLAVPGSLNDGLTAYEHGDYAMSLTILRPLATDGSADAQVALGVMYDTGKGVPQNDGTALKLYLRAANGGNAQAQNNLGVMYEKGRGVAVDFAEAAKWYRLAAAQGYAQSEKNLSNLPAALAAVPDSPLCSNALNDARQNWDAGFAGDVAEAQRRFLSIDDCRVAIGLPKLSSGPAAAPPPPTPTMAATPQPPEGNLVLSGDNRWVVVASRQDLNEAISIAKTYSALKSRVVRAQNGWFAIVLGPYPTSDIATFRRDFTGPPLPPDAVLARGTGYVETVWQPSSEASSPSVAENIDAVSVMGLLSGKSLSCFDRFGTSKAYVDGKIIYQIDQSGNK